jgi:hypothetical protein
MNRILLSNISRFVILLLLQVLVFQRISNGFSATGFNYFNIFVYPVFILLLPINMPIALTIAASFGFGLSIDWFYNSPGIHAGASVLTAFLRPAVLGILEPRGGYPPSGGPTQNLLGPAWFARYAGILLFVHLLMYFIIQFFSFVYILEILLCTVVAFVMSYTFVLMYQFLLNPKV